MSIFVEKIRNMPNLRRLAFNYVTLNKAAITIIRNLLTWRANDLIGVSFIRNELLPHDLKAMFHSEKLKYF